MNKRIRAQKIRWKKVLPLVLAVVLLCLMIYGGLRIMEPAVISNERKDGNTTKTIVKDGISYYPRQDISVVMVLGIDAKGQVVPSEEPNHGNAVDMITLLIFDEKDKIINLLSLNRDTMVEMPRLNQFGKETGTRVAQLALSHTYGRGVEDSCNNTKKTVEMLIHGLTVDYYYAMNMDAVGILNDAVGGVTVLVEDDFSAVDPTIRKGTVTLKGDQALTFIRARKDVGTQLNVSRMERQQEYMEGFFHALQTMVNSGAAEFAVETYEELSPYMVTDCSVTVMSSMLERYAAYEMGELIIPEGENVQGEQYMEFYLDEEAFDKLVLDTFYAVKN